MKKILLIIIVIILVVVLCSNNNKKENYINYDNTCIEQKAQNSKFAKSQQLTPIGVINQNNDNPLDYDLCKKNIKNINDTACSVYDGNTETQLECNKRKKCCEDKSCPCDKYLNNFGNETLFSDVIYITGNSCPNDTMGWEKCKKMVIKNQGGACVEFGQTGNFYYFPDNYADISDYPTPTVYQKCSFRPG